MWSAFIASKMLRQLMCAVARASGQLARALHRAAGRFEALEVAACACTAELLPADLLLESEPPPIPADAHRRPTPAKRKTTTQELAWQELTSGRHPHLATRRLAHPIGGS